ncbi:MAG: hypothetical protein [Microviridae sp.]|nr:MAG: hypothetical protein [Microviridae sp.]
MPVRKWLLQKLPPLLMLSHLLEMTFSTQCSPLLKPIIENGKLLINLALSAQTTTTWLSSTVILLLKLLVVMHPSRLCRWSTRRILLQVHFRLRSWVTSSRNSRQVIKPQVLFCSVSKHL